MAHLPASVAIELILRCGRHSHALYFAPEKIAGIVEVTARQVIGTFWDAASRQQVADADGRRWGGKRAYGIRA
jgi:hypothetical protein